MKQTSIRMLGLLVGFVAVLTGDGTVAQSRGEEEQRREQWQRVNDIFHAMDVKPGAVVADVGAGDGFFTSRLATAVGPSGQVFAVDVSDAQLERLRRRLDPEAHRNVTIIKGAPDDPRLPAGRLDAALIVNAYHEMPAHQAMLQSIRRALKPDGRLVIVEPIADARRDASRSDQAREHEITPEFAMQDARPAGFRIIGLEDPFTMRGRVVEWMMTVTPGTAPAVSANVAAGLPLSTGWRDPDLRISIAEFVKLSSGGATTIIDVRDEGMFAKGHIPNAVLIPLEDLEASTDRLLALERPFVTYCS